MTKSHLKVGAGALLIIIISSAFYSLKSLQSETILETYKGRPAPEWVTNPDGFYKEADNLKFDPRANPWEHSNKKIKRLVFLSSWFPDQAAGSEGDTVLEAVQRACSSSQKTEDLFWEASGKYYLKKTDFLDHEKIWWKQTIISKGFWSKKQFVGYCVIISKKKVVPPTQKHQSKGVSKNEKEI